MSHRDTSARSPPRSRGEPVRATFGPWAWRRGAGAITVDALGLCGLKLVIGLWVLHSGFTHVSDDDFARTVIAEQFAHAPGLDPSGTSWLPLPFWIEGGAMMIAGRSLGVARAIALLLGAASVIAPYLAMRSAQMQRAPAVVATIVAMLLPWNVWLAVATVPEGWAGALVAAAAIAMGAERPPGWAAAAVLAASLSRYEAWPACAVLAALFLWHATRERGERNNPQALACVLVAAAGPIAWMAWNAHAHGSAVHFLARVSAFRHTIGAADVPIADKILGYPTALLRDTPDAAALGMAGMVGIVASADLRLRWEWPLAVAAAIVVFLVIGDVRDGAPTHHPARALVAVWWLIVGVGVDALFTFVRRAGAAGWPRLATSGAATLAAIAWCDSLPSRWDSSPGRGQWDQRDSQIARGLDMRSRGVTGATIAPCSFEHFALIAAWGAPERAHLEARTGEAPTAACPRVIEW